MERRSKNPRRSGVYPSGECGDIIGESDTEWRVLQVGSISAGGTPKDDGATYLQTESGEISNRWDVSNTGTIHPPDTSGDIDFFFERQRLNL